MAGPQCKVLNVAEKNDAARELAKIMSRGRFQRVSTRGLRTAFPVMAAAHYEYSNSNLVACSIHRAEAYCHTESVTV